MKKAGIERFVVDRIKAACEDAIRETIAALNAEGHAFEPADDYLCEFREPGATWSLQIHAGVSAFVTNAEPVRAEDPVDQAFYAAAEAGDPVAARLVALEADVGNGGFDQLHLNKGLEFIEACIGDLERLGAKSTLKYVTQARDLFVAHADVFAREDELRRALHRLDRRFNARKESLAALHQRAVPRR